VDNQVDNLQRRVDIFLSKTISFRHRHKDQHVVAALSRSSYRNRVWIDDHLN